MKINELKAEILRLQAENDSLRLTIGAKRPFLKVSPKGGVSLYGVGRYPVTLYESQWQTVLSMAEEIRAFLGQHRDKLARRG